MADIRNANNIGPVRAVLHDQINQNTKSHTHTECAPARLRVDEQTVHDIISCVEEFDCYPFDVTSPTLHTLQSAIPASPELIRDFSTAIQDGESKLQSFQDDLLYARETSLYDRIKRSCRLSFTCSRYSKVTRETVSL